MCESLYAEIVNTLKISESEYDPEKKCKLLGLATRILQKSSYDLKTLHSATIQGWVRPTSAADNSTPEDLKKVKPFFSQCTDCEHNCQCLCNKTDLLFFLQAAYMY